MLALVMCGGKGSRMALPIEKSLLKLRDKTLIEYVLDALIDYRGFENIVVVPSANTPATCTFLYAHKYYTSGIIEIFEGRGENYSRPIVCPGENKTCRCFCSICRSSITKSSNNSKDHHSLSAFFSLHFYSIGNMLR